MSSLSVLSNIFAPLPAPLIDIERPKMKITGGFGQGMVRVEFSTFDHGTLDFIGLVRVVKVVKGIFTLSRTRARMYFHIFLSTFILILKFDFIENTLDHLDHVNNFKDFYLDQTFDHP